MMSPVLVLAVVGAVAQTPGVSQPRASVSVEISVTDRSGTPLSSAHVALEGHSEREGTTNRSGRLMLLNMKSGSYVLRAEHEGFIPLEKEFTVRPGRPLTVTAMLSPAPPPAVLTGPIGHPGVLSIPEFAERQLIQREAIKESPIGCSGAAEARLIQVRETLATDAHRDAEEMLYVVAGEAAIKIGEVEQRVAPGWFSLIPRGTAHSLSRKGRNPVVLLSLLSGQPCPDTLAHASAGR